MKNKVLIILPPFTQLNTPYPSTTYLKGYLNSIYIDSKQVDLGIETILDVFSSNGLKEVFEIISKQEIRNLSEPTKRIIQLKEEYLKTIDQVIAFLQYKNLNLARLICNGNYLPQAGRLVQTDDLEWAFGIMGNQDKARHLATLYLEDLGDLVTETIDPHFGFSRYAEHLGRYANEFDELDKELGKPESHIDYIMLRILDTKIKEFNPDLLAISIPFPGNLLSALRCASFVKKNYPEIKTAIGGGFVSTELRSLSDSRVFKYLDFVCLDDGELPLERILKYTGNEIDKHQLKRTFICEKGQVLYIDDARVKDLSHNQQFIPDYSDLLLEKYLSVIEIANPMHSLWSNGRWNKLMLAHGCYWAKCSFCDTSLDYIQRFVPSKAKLLVDKIEAIIAQTGENGFHFVDEAAPPSILRDLALEILQRKLTLVWWTNIRFEKNFTNDLCRLLAASGCIAVSGGLEVAFDRLLKLINKGVDIEQVAKSANNFTSAGIMVHAYLMYGFPTQTDQETIDSLEVVRQLFEAGIIQSGFWHRFALTVHSPVAQNAEFYKINIRRKKPGRFANNDLEYDEFSKINHEKYAEGLRISLYNFMHGAGFELPLQKWFGFKIPGTSIKSHLIKEILSNFENRIIEPGKRLKWLGNLPGLSYFSISKRGIVLEMAEMSFVTRTKTIRLKFTKNEAEWLFQLFGKILTDFNATITIKEIELEYYNLFGVGFQAFMQSKKISVLRENGLLIL